MSRYDRLPEQNDAEEQWLASQNKRPDFLSDVYGAMFQEIRNETATQIPDLNVRQRAKDAIQAEEDAIKAKLASTEGAISMKFLATADLMKDALKPLIETTPLAPLTDSSGQPVADGSTSTGMSTTAKIALGVTILIVIVVAIVVGVLYSKGTFSTAATPATTAAKTMTAFPAWQLSGGLGTPIDAGPPFVQVPRVDFYGPSPPGNWYDTGMNGPKSQTYITPFKSVEFPQQQLFYRYAYDG